MTVLVFLMVVVITLLEGPLPTVYVRVSDPGWFSAGLLPSSGLFPGLPAGELVFGTSTHFVQTVIVLVMVSVKVLVWTSVEASGPMPLDTVIVDVTVVVMILVVMLGPRVTDGVEELVYEGNPLLALLEYPELTAAEDVTATELKADLELDPSAEPEGVREGME